MSAPHYWVALSVTFWLGACSYTATIREALIGGGSGEALGDSPPTKTARIAKTARIISNYSRSPDGSRISRAQQLSEDGQRVRFHR
jgi:hypothetical protein